MKHLIRRMKHATQEAFVVRVEPRGASRSHYDIVVASCVYCDKPHRYGGARTRDELFFDIGRMAHCCWGYYDFVEVSR